MTDGAVVLTFVGRRRVFLQLTPVGRADTIGQILVSPVPFSGTADNTSVSK